MSVIITREYIISLLENWQNGVINAGQLYDTVNELYDNNQLKFIDWDNNEDGSVSLEISRYLESLELNLCKPEDVPHYIKFLRTAPEDWEKGYEEWDNYLNSIDFEKRRKELKDIYPYSKILNEL